MSTICLVSCLLEELSICHTDTFSSRVTPQSGMETDIVLYIISLYRKTPHFAALPWAMNIYMLDNWESARSQTIETEVCYHRHQLSSHPPDAILMQALENEEADSWIHESLHQYFITLTVQVLKEDAIQMLFTFQVANVAAWVHGWKPQRGLGFPDEDCQKVMISSYPVLNFLLTLMVHYC